MLQITSHKKIWQTHRPDGGEKKPIMGFVLPEEADRWPTWACAQSGSEGNVICADLKSLTCLSRETCVTQHNPQTFLMFLSWLLGVNFKDSETAGVKEARKGAEILACVSQIRLK